MGEGVPVLPPSPYSTCYPLINPVKMTVYAFSPSGELNARAAKAVYHLGTSTRLRYI